jgi:hypothetical protein
MLEAARIEVEDQKRDVVVGIAETHGRYDTGSLLIGLELLPRRVIEHRGIKLEEFDLDGALGADRSCSSSTSSRTPTRRARVTSSAGRTSRSSSTQASTSSRRSTCSTSRA